MICDEMKPFKSAKKTSSTKELLKYVSNTKKANPGKNGYILSIDLNVETENVDSGMTYETISTFLFHILKKKDEVKSIKKMYNKLTIDEKRAVIYSEYLKKEHSDLKKRREWIYSLSGTLKMKVVS
jgi:hypothetical protein